MTQGLPRASDCDSVIIEGDYAIDSPTFAWADGLSVIGLEVRRHPVFRDGILQRGTAAGETWERVYRGGWWSSWTLGFGSGRPLPVGNTPVQPLGTNLVVNGDFATAASWTLGTGWSIAAGVATHAGAASGYLYQAITLEPGEVYKLQLTVSAWTAGIVEPHFMRTPTSQAGPAFFTKAALGTFAGATLCPADATGIGFFAVPQNSQSTFSIDNVILQKMTLAGKPLEMLARWAGNV